MRWLSFYHGGKVRPGVLLQESNGIIDLCEEEEDWPCSWKKILEENLLSDISERYHRKMWKSGPIPLNKLRLAPPVPSPSKVIAIGLNYRDHAEEQKKEAPMRPLLFAKAPSCLIGQGEPIRLPAGESKPDVEAEMAFILQKRACQVRPEKAYEYIAGITVMNDVSGREAQYGDRQWFRGKSFDTFGPIGPWVVTLDEIGDPQRLALRCFVNGECRQDGNTSDMIFGIRELLSYISHQMTLMPGDVVSTGTPAGVGVFRDPPLFIEAGDRIEIELEGVGKLMNTVE
ncbi:MAG: fumarylacetoacetate hydrolase family protein [Candidatus Eisenbacteria bacterium]|uniref:Fumarylacetoacetate hydrolase family protein n=1 Tax=Eiseniibacteriota bacterium TaxID=2212470 RepID=A0A948RYS8_UNCEI|nr:fumarylacetoacetate hydrolase family protein [Candidatus Eisenbacteria bacterium]MBU1947358.1 fumarylacetoacetate hydrolase family protein [Candidatus Eisenbacteria bacterium]MBU2692461.1 fumarylacetoacetate hydrolase family protein [Candidatus Eisenbacteria bacterium]